MRKLSFMGFAALLSLTACAPWNDPNMLRTSKENIDFDAYQSAKGIMVGYQLEGQAHFCAMPLPDYAMNREISVDPKLAVDSLKKESLDLHMLYKSNVIALRNRENTLYMMREALFNLCVASSRYKLDSAAYMKSFDKIIELAFSPQLKEKEKNDSLVKLQQEEKK